MARALRAWAINRGGKTSVRNLRYGPRTQLVRGINNNNKNDDNIKFFENHIGVFERRLAGLMAKERILCQVDRFLNFDAKYV